MQDGAPPHFASTVRQFLIHTFTQERLISRGCNLVWPSRSPDLNPLDYWFWGTLKARIFHTNPPTTNQTLKSRIMEECGRFTVEEFSAAVSSLTGRIELLLTQDGGQFEHLR